jgi:hypothetical protein
MTSTNLTDEERKSLTALYRCLTAMAELNSQMPIGEAATFVQVALDPNHGPDGYSKMTGFPDSSVSRWLLDLSTQNRGATEVQLLGWRPNPENLRRKQYYVVGRGFAMISVFLKALGRAAA